MQLTITGQHLDITSALQQFVNTKFEKIQQYHDHIQRVSVVLKVEKLLQIAEATIFFDGGEIHASAEHQDMYAAIDLLLDKLIRQLNKHKEKLHHH